MDPLNNWSNATKTWSGMSRLNKADILTWKQVIGSGIVTMAVSGTLAGITYFAFGLNADTDASIVGWAMPALPIILWGMGVVPSFL